MVTPAGRLIVRWSLRDLRQRAVLVAAIALLLALGTGLFTGLGSMESWRVASNDASFAQLGVHDLRVQLSEGSFVPRGDLARIARGALDGATVEERLIAPTQVEVTADGEPLVVTGQLVGVEVEGGGPTVDGIAAAAGRALGPPDAGEPVVMLDLSFADARGLPDAGDALVGGSRVRYVGHGQSPEYFVITEGDAGFQFPGGFAIVFAPLATAEALAAREGLVNDLVLRLPPGVDRDSAQDAIQEAFTSSLPAVGTRVTTTEEIGAHRILYRDAEGDQRLMNIFAALVLLGAALAAFNLISRVVESQRREIGISMALGASTGRIALRPALLGLQIAVLGTALGVVVGILIARVLGAVLEDQLLLPTVETPFEAGVFARGAALSVTVVAAATAYPVWRGVRVTPVEAIRVGARTAVRGGLLEITKNVRVPGRSLSQLPLRSVVRTPRRTAMTAGGIAAVIAVIIALLGTLTVFQDMLDRSERVTLGDTPDRVVVTMAGIEPVDGSTVAAVSDSPTVRIAEPWLRVPGRLAVGDRAIDIVLGTVPADDGLWSPEMSAGTFSAGDPGVLISAVAAEELGVGPGDTVRLTHPAPRGDASFALETSTVRVAGTHADPVRGLTYIGGPAAGDLGLAGLANAVNVLPAQGTSANDVARALVTEPGVASVEGAAATTEALQSAIDDYVQLLLVPVAIAMLLALLIAFNSSAIGADERRREHATMFAFGLRPRTPVALACVENALIGLLGTLAGIGLGVALLWWIVTSQFPEVLPEFGGRVVLSPWSVVAAVVAGVVVVSLAPLLTLRRLRRTDVPSELRVME